MYGERLDPAELVSLGPPCHTLHPIPDTLCCESRARFAKEKVSGIFFTDSERIPNLFGLELRLRLAVP
jgi:hypothetical protein